MRAAWYERRGPASEALQFGEMPDPSPGPGEVRIRVSVSGISPGDVKKRSGWQGSPMPYPRVIPHSDGAGIIDAVGAGVDPARKGRFAWCYGAQSYRAFGTAAELVVVPERLAIDLPDGASPALLERAASLGIPGITGYRAVFADGPVKGLTVLVWGAASGVGAFALQMAVRDGADVIGIVRSEAQRQAVLAMGAKAALVADSAGLVEAIRAAAPEGVNRIADVDFAGHIETNAAVVAIGATISAYYTSDDHPKIPYWTLGFADVALRLLGSDDFSPEVKLHAAQELSAALVEGKLTVPIASRLPLAEIAAAHEVVEHGSPGRVVLTIAN
jgi:NADPH2:quinone reductase